MSDALPVYGDFAYDPDARKLKGLLVPFGVPSRSGLNGHEGTVFTAETLRIPRDVSVVTLNRNHDRHDPVGRATVLEPRPEGLYAEFALADTAEADEWLGSQRDSLRKLSPEVFFDTDRKSARLTGAGLVGEGAWPQAGLFALAEAPAAEPTEIAKGGTGSLTAAEAAEHIRNVVAGFSGDTSGLAQIIAALTQATPQTPEGTPPSDTPDEEEVSDMGTSVIPDGGAPTPVDDKIDTSASGLFAALTKARATGDKSVLAALSSQNDRSGLFAAYAPLNDITATAAANTFPPQFIGEVYKRDEWLQTVLPLFLHDDLKALTVNGWAWNARPTVGAYAGDKAAIPSNTPTFSQVTTTAERIAGGHDVDRALRDFGNDDFWSSYFRIMTEEYKKQADAKVYAKIAAAAPTVTPTAVTGTQDPGTMAVIDGALAVIAAGYTPTFAMVSTAIFRSFLVTPKDKVLEYLSSAFSLDGAGSDGGRGGLGGFKIVPNTSLTAKRVIVGSRVAATVYELPGSPIRVEGLDVAHAGIDPAVYGYVATQINDAAALASVTTL